MAGQTCTAVNVNVNVRLFAGLQDLVGGSAIDLGLPAESTVRGLCELVFERYPVLEALLPTLFTTMGEEIVPPDRVFRDGDNVEFVPPFGGGHPCEEG